MKALRWRIQDLWTQDDAPLLLLTVDLVLQCTTLQVLQVGRPALSSSVRALVL